MIAIICIILTIIYTLLNVAKVAIRNYTWRQFFKTKSPNLPVAPGSTFFAGHIYTIIRQDKNYRILSELHDKYGPTFGLFYCHQPWVSTKDVDLLKLIEVDEAHKHINRCDYEMPFEEFNESIFHKLDENWRRARRAVAPALTNHKVRSEEISSDIEYVLGQLAESLENKMSRAEKLTGSRSFVLDVLDTCQRYSLAVIFLITYKQDRVIDFNAEVDEWTATMQQGARDICNPLITTSMMFPFIRPMCRFLVQFHHAGKLAARVIDFITKATDINRGAREFHEKYQRKMSIETGAKMRDFSDLKRSGDFKRRMVDTIIDAFLDKRMKYEEFIGTTFFMLLAGFQTTADTISCLIWQLAHNSDIQTRLRDSILTNGIDDDFVVWCIMETIRLHPAVPLGTGRTLTRDVTVNGTFLAKGTFVMPSTYAIHHDPSLWPEPDKFKPDRWKEQASFHPAAFMGFGLGPRNCVGGKLAVHEIKLVMKLILTKYRIEKCNETPKAYDFSSPGLIYTLPDEPIKVRLVELCA